MEKLENKMPSEMLSSFLAFIDQSCKEYHFASDEVGKEDRKVQDYIHMIEFAQDKPNGTEMLLPCSKAEGTADNKRIRPFFMARS